MNTNNRLLFEEMEKVQANRDLTLVWNRVKELCCSDWSAHFDFAGTQAKLSNNGNAYEIYFIDGRPVYITTSKCR